MPHPSPTTNSHTTSDDTEENPFEEDYHQEDNEAQLEEQAIETRWEQTRADILSNPIFYKWKKLWKQKVVGQIDYGYCLLIRGISCLAMKHGKEYHVHQVIDPRVPLIFISSSGSGKGLGVGIYHEIFTKLGLKIFNADRPTIQKLVGSTNTTIQEKNDKKGFKEGSEGWRDPVIPGILEENDDIIFDECAPFFENKEGEEYLRLIRRMLDNHGSPNNYLQSETLKNISAHGYYCKCNVIMLSYFFKNVKEKVVDNGIFQRFLALFNKMDEEQLLSIIKKENINVQKYNEAKEEILNELRDIETFIASCPKTITAKEDAIRLINKTLADSARMIYSNDDEAELGNSFINRQKDLYVKIAGTIALLKKRNVIYFEDVVEADALIENSFNSVKKVIFEDIYDSKEEKWIKDCKKVLGTTYHAKMEVYNLMAKYWKVSSRTAMKRIKKFDVMLKESKNERIKNEKLVRMQ